MDQMNILKMELDLENARSDNSSNKNMSFIYQDHNSVLNGVVLVPAMRLPDTLPTPVSVVKGSSITCQ